jgi:hypothetical protein
MNLFALAQALVQGAASLPMDENSLSMLVLLVGIVGGVLVTGYYKQLKAKAIKAERKPDRPRKPD